MRELRAISFTEREVSAALIEFSGRLKRKLPVGTVMDAVVSEGPPSHVILPIKDDYGELHNIKYSETEVAASLVHFCMGRRVRLPARGEKVLQIIAGQPTLVIWLPDGQAGPSRAAIARRIAKTVASG